jgi:hypothetical protein
VSSIGAGSVLAVAADASGICFSYFQSASNTSGIWKLPNGSATPIHLADGVGTYGYLGVSDSHIFWENWESGWGVIKKAPKDGSGSASVILKLNDPSLNMTRFASDGTYMYWAASQSLYRSPK